MMRKLLIAAIFAASFFEALELAVLAEDFAEVLGGEPGAVCAGALETASAAVPSISAHATDIDRTREQRRNRRFGRKLFTEALGVFSTISLERP